MKIKQTTAIITGGASGMGRETAKMLQAAGATVILFDINQENLQKVANELKVKGIVVDITQSESVDLAIQEAQKFADTARIWINCAGIVHGRRLVNKQGPMPLEDFERVIKINLIGTFNVMRLASATMIPLSPLNADNERGIIINTASIAAFEGQIGQCAYSASKGGIVSLGLPAARELAKFGIRVMTIAPGLVDTPMFAQIPKEARAALANMVPFPHRLALPEEYSMLVKQIIENPMLNGSVIRLDGALRMQAE